MISPKIKIIQLPDYSDYIGKEFIVTEDTIFEEPNFEEVDEDEISEFFNRPILKGVRFTIKKIENSNVTIKITNSKDELRSLGMLEYDFNRIITEHEETIQNLKKIVQLWNDEPEKFVKKSKEAHCINTGYYGIPLDHPSKYGMAAPYFDKEKGEYYPSDSIMTHDYRRTDKLLNIYSYQEGTNEYYSKECYEYMLKADELELEDWKKRTKKYEKWIFDWILEKTEMTIKELNKIKFELYEETE